MTYICLLNHAFIICEYMSVVYDLMCDAIHDRIDIITARIVKPIRNLSHYI